MADTSDTIWLTTEQAAAHATNCRQLLTAGTAHVTPATIRQWDSRGHLTGRSAGPRQPKLYRLEDIARAELATRDRALRLASISTI